MAACATCSTPLADADASCPVCEPWRTGAPAAAPAAAKPAAFGKNRRAAAVLTDADLATLPWWAKALSRGNPLEADYRAAFRAGRNRIMASGAAATVSGAVYLLLAARGQWVNPQEKYLLLLVSLMLYSLPAGAVPGRRSWLADALATARTRPALGAAALVEQPAVRRTVRLGFILQALYFATLIVALPHFSTLAAEQRQFWILGVCWLLLAVGCVLVFFTATASAYRVVDGLLTASARQPAAAPPVAAA